jgi:hypothetical protein
MFSTKTFSRKIFSTTKLRTILLRKVRKNNSPPPPRLIIIFLLLGTHRAQNQWWRGLCEGQLQLSLIAGLTIEGNAESGITKEHMYATSEHNYENRSASEPKNR